MGFRFRRSIRIAPGVRLNLNKRSVGVSVGGRGLRYSVNSKGRRTGTVGVPGTGLSYQHVSTPKKWNARQATLPAPGLLQRGTPAAAQPAGQRLVRVLGLLLCMGIVVVLVLVAIHWSQT